MAATTPRNFVDKAAQEVEAKLTTLLGGPPFANLEDLLKHTFVKPAGTVLLLITLQSLLGGLRRIVEELEAEQTTHLHWSRKRRNPTKDEIAALAAADNLDLAQQRRFLELQLDANQIDTEYNQKCQVLIDTIAIQCCKQITLAIDAVDILTPGQQEMRIFLTSVQAGVAFDVHLVLKQGETRIATLTKQTAEYQAELAALQPAPASTPEQQQQLMESAVVQSRAEMLKWLTQQMHWKAAQLQQTRFQQETQAGEERQMALNNTDAMEQRCKDAPPSARVTLIQEQLAEIRAGIQATFDQKLVEINRVFTEACDQLTAAFEREKRANHIQ